MKVEILRQFLLSLRAPVEAADPRSSLAADLNAAAELLGRFSRYDIDQFGAFLARAVESLQSGELTVPGPVETQANDLGSTARRLDERLGRLAESGATPDVKTEVGRLKGELRAGVERLVEPFGLSATFKDDPKWFDKYAQAVRATVEAQRLRESLRGIEDPAELRSEAVQNRLDEIAERAGLDLIKAIARECDVKPSGRDPTKILNSVAEKITGFRFPKAPAKGKSAKAVDRDKVERQSERFRAAMRRSFEPGGLSRDELAAVLGEMEELDLSELKAVASEVDLALVGRTKNAILGAFRERLTEARRAEEGIEV